MTARPLSALAMPAAFVLLWGSGFIAAKAGLSGAEPMTFLALRYAIVTVLMGLVALACRAPWPASRGEAAHVAVAGFFMQTVYFGAAWVSMSQGVGAGVAAIIICTHPVLTAVLAGPLLGDRVTARQALGFVLGLGGVVLVVFDKLSLGAGTPAAMAWSGLSLLGMTIGTLYQKRFCPRMDPRSGGAIQFAVGALTAAPLALAFEDTTIRWSTEVVLALLYVSVVISLVSVTLLAIMIRRGRVTQVASLFFLVPPTAAVVAWIVLGETLALLSVLGMAVAAAGVALVVKPARA